MILKNIELINAVGGLRKLNEASLPIKVSYKVTKNIMTIEGELAVYNAEKQKLINKYGEKDSKGELIMDENNQVNIVDIVGWTNDINELDNMENDISIEKINLDSIDIDITPSELATIIFMFD